MKIFLDTNILFSAILFPGSIPSMALIKALSYPNTCITCDYVLDELKRTFSKKFPNKIDALNRFYSEFVLCIDIVKVNETIYEEESLIRDDKDHPVLRAAIYSKADILITGDKDFLESNIKKPMILTAREFIELE